MCDDHAELWPLSRPRARYQSRAGVPRSLARPFIAASPIASVIMPARVRLSTAVRAAAASITSTITCCRRLPSRASCRVPADTEAGAVIPMLMVMSSRSPRDHPVRCGHLPRRACSCPARPGARTGPSLAIYCLRLVLESLPTGDSRPSRCQHPVSPRSKAVNRAEIRKASPGTAVQSLSFNYPTALCSIMLRH
jgi:hypothetical protein